MIYVLQVMTGKELTVRRLLEQRSITAYVPRERILIRKGGLWSKMIKLLFPSYVFVDINFSAEMFHIINPIPGVIRFLGLPTPLPEHEADLIRWLSNGGEIIEPSYALTDEFGNIVGYEGFLENNTEKIKRLNLRQRKAAVEVIFDGKVHKANVGIEIKKANALGQG